MPNNRAVRAVLCCLLAATVFTACADSASGGGDDAGAGLVQNESRWSLPLDEYFGLDFAVSDYAERLLVRDCMEPKGFTYPVGAAQRVDAPPHPTRSASYRKLFNEEIAATYGYGGPAVAQPTASLDPEEMGALESDAGQGAFRECLEKTREELPLPPDRGLAESLAVAGYNAAINREEVVDAAERWRKCMEPLGITDLPDTPEGMPSQSLRAEWGEAPDDPQGRELTVDEVRIATHDATCRSSSRFSELLYQAEWNIQLEMLTDNEAALERLASANEEHAGLVEVVITDHG